MNTATPRIFIAATEQNAGKTTTALGIYSVLRHRYPGIGYIKPVGQRFTEIEGKRIDEDSILIRETFNTQVPIEDMSPIAVEPDFTRRYIDSSNQDLLIRRIQNSFDRATWEKDFAIIEGTGHAGVGSVFDLSNASVAKHLSSKVLLVTSGGIGRPIDEAALNKALFDQEGVEIIGVIMNKVIPSKLEYIADFARRGFKRLGLDLLGVIPQERILAEPTLADVALRIRGEFIASPELSRRRIAAVTIGAMSANHVMERLEDRTLLVVPGDREEVLLAALDDARNARAQIAGVVLSESLRPSPALEAKLKASPLPTLASPMDSYTIASRIHSMTVKTLPGDSEKIDRIQSLVEASVDLDQILARVT